MTQDEIIRMAREAGFTDYYPERLTRFAALVAAHERKKCEQEMSLMEEHCAELILAEREACANVCEQGTGEAVQTVTLETLLQERKRIAEAIITRGKK